MIAACGATAALPTLVCSCSAHPLRLEVWIMALPAIKAESVRSPKCSAISLAAMHSPFYVGWRLPNPKLPRGIQNSASYAMLWS